MSRAIKEALRELKTWVVRNPSRMTSLASGNGTPGTRAAPTRTDKNDKAIGLRLDNGETVTKDGQQYKRYKLQANKDADDKAIRDLAKKNSHLVLSQADLPLDKFGPEEATDYLFGELMDNIDVPK
ncbi:hypothetical protein BDZ85DRAFT_255723 [Elsinoe ampelina]|uniref:Uncharacterized protein n=1 Tax=Elsinoe ampelina TaxID=302913 RepID=A0A6A6GRA0_9PEZI|nr:hypothetical protein BDZ85DRAFT_255723 [Elsinoe ampelina]